MSDGTKALSDECQRQFENCLYTSITFTIWLRFLKSIRAICMVAPVIFGALATWKMVAQTSPTWGAVFTLLATVIPPAYAASKTNAAIEEYTTAAGTFTNLRDRFRQAALISSQKPLGEFEAEVHPLLDRIEKARQRMLTPPEWCFKLARRKIKRSDYEHDYDQQSAPTA
jgi:hypothetical protein